MELPLGPGPHWEREWSETEESPERTRLGSQRKRGFLGACGQHG